MSKRAAIYARVSGDDTHNEGRNLEGQLAMGREFAQEHEYTVVREFAEDARGVSGADWDAPELQEALTAAQAGEFEVLIVREIDRLARKLAKQLVIEQEFAQTGVKVEYVLGDYADTPEGQFQKHVMATIAEYEREVITRRLTRGRRQAAKRGNIRLMGSPAPYGYKWVDDEFVIDEEEAYWVRQMYTWYTQDEMGIHQIVVKLNDLGVREPDPEKRQRRGWGRISVWRILSSETYAGTWYYGKKTAQPIPIAVPAIVRRETWEAAQRQRKKNKCYARCKVKYNYLMRRRLTCGRCGGKMNVYRSGKYSYYHCGTRYACDRERCSLPPGVPTATLDRAVWTHIYQLFANPHLITEGLERQYAQQESANYAVQQRIAALGELVLAEERKVKRLLQLFAEDESYAVPVVQAEIRQQIDLTKRLQSERAQLQAQLERTASLEEQIAQAQAHLADLLTTLNGSLNLINESASFELRKWIIDKLDVQGIMDADEQGKKVGVHSVLLDLCWIYL